MLGHLRQLIFFAFALGVSQQAIGQAAEPVFISKRGNVLSPTALYYALNCEPDNTGFSEGGDVPSLGYVSNFNLTQNSISFDLTSERGVITHFQFPLEIVGSDIQFRAKGLPGIRHNTMFHRSTDIKKSFRFTGWEKCAALGFLPGDIQFLVDPNDTKSASSWVERNSALLFDAPDHELLDAAKTTLISSKLRRFEFDGYSVFMVSAYPGNEEILIDNLIKQDWVLDVSMLPFPLGTPAGVMFFSGDNLDRKVKKEAEAQVALRNVIEETYVKTFPKFDIGNLEIGLEGGTAFSFTLKAPTSQLFRKLRTEWKGRWLIAKGQMTFWSSVWIDNGVAKPMRYAAFNFSDGYLPKWNEEEAPPESHYVQFALSEDGENNTSNNDILYAVQSELFKRFQEMWNGRLVEE